MPVTAEPKATAIQDTSVENNLGLVHACAHRFKGRGIEYDDLYQAGCMGLVKASAAFDAGRGVMFSTYAVPVILGEIRRLFRDGGTVKVSRSLKELGLAAGFNGARLHQKVFEERYYYWADRLGYITWGESPSWGMDANDVETARNFLSEWAECVVRDRNHPSLLTWTPMNEEWWPDNTQFPRFASDVYDLTGRLDPTRPVNTVSGGAVVRTDIWAVHNYEQNPAKLKEKIFSDGTFFHPRLRTTRDQTRNIGFNEVKATANYAWPQYDGSCPYLVDEFGGIKWVKDQEKQATDSQTESWGYGQAPRTLEEFYTRLEGQVDALLSLSRQVWGYCYTQLTDVEQEQNGIYCYDRSAKFDMDRIKAIFSKRPEHPAR